MDCIISLVKKAVWLFLALCLGTVWSLYSHYIGQKVEHRLIVDTLGYDPKAGEQPKVSPEVQEWSRNRNNQNQ